MLCGSDTVGMIVTLGNSARRHSALCMYNDCSFRAATTNTSSRCGRSRIAATAIDHIGANPVPLATRTERPSNVAAPRRHRDILAATGFGALDWSGFATKGSV